MMVLEQIVDLHAEEAAFLWFLRDRSTHAPHYKFRDLLKLDNRLEAHLDGLRISGDTGWKSCLAQIEGKQPGEVFAPAVLAIAAGDNARIESVLAQAEKIPCGRRGLASAFGWLPWQSVANLAGKLLDSSLSIERWAGLVCYAVHRRDPGKALSAGMKDTDQTVRRCALRIAGELGRRDLLPHCQAHFDDMDEGCRFWSARSAILLGDRSAVVHIPATLQISNNAYRQRAVQLTAMVTPVTGSELFLHSLTRDFCDMQLLIQATGLVGDPTRIPWLIQQMRVAKWARVAGEAFTLITGIDLASANLDCAAPEDFESGPNEDRGDEKVELDADADLAWPHAESIQQWWHSHSSDFRSRLRYFCGQEPSLRHCYSVLERGYQRQRLFAALHLAFTNPSLPLFDCRAPAWIQSQRLKGHV